MKKQRRYRIRYRRDGRDARIARHLAGTTDTLMLSYAAMQKQKATIDALVKERDSLRIANRNGLSLLEAAQKSANDAAIINNSLRIESNAWQQTAHKMGEERDEIRSRYELMRLMFWCLVTADTLLFAVAAYVRFLAR